MILLYRELPETRPHRGESCASLARSRYTHGWGHLSEHCRMNPLSDAQKAARREYMREWRKRHIEHLRQQEKKYRAAHKEHYQALWEQYEKAHYSELQEKRSEYRQRVAPLRNPKQRLYNFKHRFRIALRDSKTRATKGGYAPCTATIEEIKEAFTGHCHNPSCNRREESDRKLHLDHCHATGRFRGWLCSRCNHALGLLEDSPGKLRALAAFVSHFATPGGCE